MVDMQAEIRNKILGALLADARESSGKSVHECAATLGVSEDVYAAFESGQRTPTLPQMEALAYLFRVSLEHFWGTDTLEVARSEQEVKASVSQFIALRDKLIGATLRGLRDENAMSVEQLAAESGLTVEQIESYELGREPVPVDDLRLITAALKVSLDELADDSGTIGSWLQLQTEFDRFRDLPDDLRAFLLKPINRSYLDLAMRLSGLSVERLRGIAEGILDITY